MGAEGSKGGGGTGPRNKSMVVEQPSSRWIRIHTVVTWTYMCSKEVEEEWVELTHDKCRNPTY